MDIEREITQIGNSKGVILPVDLLKYLELDIGSVIILRDDTNKRGQRFVSFWPKGR